MDERVADGKASGDSRTGRRLFSGLRRIGAQVLDRGPLRTGWCTPVSTAIRGTTIFSSTRLSIPYMGALQSSQELGPQSLAEWVRVRHSQVESRELVYIAHQLDVLARVR